MDNILVSVIIPIYNVEKYVRKCIESAINQTLKEIEIICVDDGSRDASADIAAELGETDNRIKILSIENSGLSAARNVGIEEASGKYICFLDSDDWLAVDAAERLAEYGEKYGADVVFFNAEPVFETAEIEERQSSYKNYYARRESYPGVFGGEELFVKMMEYNDFKPSACLALINRGYMEHQGLRFYPGILHEDNLFTLQLIQKAQRAAVLDRPFYKRLIREASITSGEKGIRNAYGFFVCQRQMEAVIREEGCSPAFSAALEKYFQIMRKNAVNMLKGRKPQDIRNEIVQLDSEAENSFLEYVSGGGETAVSDTVSGRIMRKLHSLEKRGVHFLKWFWRMTERYGPGYFLYRRRLKKSDKVCVSIIVPLYNAERYLPQTLDCLTGQVLRNIEIICVDDGSTDSSSEILKQYQEKDSRIKVFRKEKAGAGSARNYGMSVAVGEYLLFLDADDIFDENLCNEVYYQSIRCRADICLFGARRLDMCSQKIENMNWVLRNDMAPGKKVFSGREIGGRLFQITTGCPWSKMFRREFVLKSGLEYQSLPNANDAYFVRMCMALADRITVVPRRFVTYRFNAGDNIQSNKAQAPGAFHEAFKAIRGELCSRGVYDIYEQSFCNMVLKESLFNLRTVNTEEAKKWIRDLLRREYFDYYGLKNHPADYYYDRKEYLEMWELLEGRDV